MKNDIILITVGIVLAFSLGYLNNTAEIEHIESFAPVPTLAPGETFVFIDDPDKTIKPDKPMKKSTSPYQNTYVFKSSLIGQGIHLGATVGYVGYRGYRRYFKRKIPIESSIDFSEFDEL